LPEKLVFLNGGGVKSEAEKTGEAKKQKTKMNNTDIFFKKRNLFRIVRSIIPQKPYPQNP
jgi:hypothetical protein